MRHAVNHREIDQSEPVSGRRDSDDALVGPLAIVGIDPELGFAGGETQVLGLTLALAREGHRAELICDPAGRLWERARAAQIKCHPLAIRNSLDVPAAIRMRAILKRERYDVIHFHTSRAHAMAPWTRGFARALIVTRRMDYRPNRLFAPLLFNRAVDRVVAISRGVADSLLEAGVDRSRIVTVPSGVDCDRFHPPSSGERAHARASLGIQPEEIVISAIGMLEPRKGHRYLIDAISMLTAPGSSAGQGIQLRCIIAGDGSLRGELARQIAETGCSSRVTMLGQTDDVREVLWASDLFAMPSLKEGLGVAVLEAMAVGLPAIASKVGGLGEVVEHDRTGILIEPARPDQLASAIARLADSSQLRSAMGAAARARAEVEYSMNAMAERTMALYRGILAGVRRTTVPKQ
jgi:glycosyltransferase involved in cell wall biosynthesis